MCLLYIAEIKDVDENQIVQNSNKQLAISVTYEIKEN